ncbi:MAG: hypothetical protein AcusKO_04150 [Acuticoccus sp.]
MSGAAAACPICGAPQSREARPFCSRRCADIDLHRWLSGQYAIPVVEEDGGDPDEPATGDEAGDDRAYRRSN